MKLIKLIAVLTILGVVAFFAFINVFMIKIDVGETGVRTKQYAVLGEKGVEPRDFGPGWHRSLPMLDTWNIFDSTVQTTEFTTSQERKANYKRFSLFSSSIKSNYPGTGPERIELKSKDGYTVKLDVTVKYRIAPDKVNELYRTFNTEARYKGIVRDQVQNTLRSVFGTMRTEEFYNPEVRRAKTETAYLQLKEDLEASFIHVINILIRDISFDTSYERKILDKKLADQDVELNKSRAFAEEKKGLTNKIVAETEAMVRVIGEEKNAAQLRMQAETDKEIAQIQADAQVTVSRITADANLYAAELNAKGNLLEKEAEAQGEKLKADALNTPGGKNLVTLEIIEQLSLGDITVSTEGIDFLNVESMMKRLGGGQ